MKKILVLFLVCSVVDAGPYWNLFNRGYSGPHQLPKFPSPKGPPEPVQHHHHDPHEPLYNLDSIRLQVIQNCNPKDECSLAVLCRNPATGVMTINEISSASIIKQTEMPNNEDRSDDNPDTQQNNNKDPDNGGSTVTPQHIISSPEPQIDKTPNYYGGEGRIDVRFGDN